MCLSYGGQDVLGCCLGVDEFSIQMINEELAVVGSDGEPHSLDVVVILGASRNDHLVGGLVGGAFNADGVIPVEGDGGELAPLNLQGDILGSIDDDTPGGAFVVGINQESVVGVRGEGDALLGGDGIEGAIIIIIIVVRLIPGEAAGVLDDGGGFGVFDDGGGSGVFDDGGAAACSQASEQAKSECECDDLLH